MAVTKYYYRCKTCDQMVSRIVTDAGLPAPASVIGVNFYSGDPVVQGACIEYSEALSADNEALLDSTMLDNGFVRIAGPEHLTLLTVKSPDDSIWVIKVDNEGTITAEPEGGWQ